MANKKINELAAAAGVSGTDLMIVGDPTLGTSYKTTLQSIADFVGLPPVTSVFGRTGAITATAGDYTIGQIGGIVLTSPTTNQLLQYNGTNWVNVNFPGVTSVGVSVPTGLAVTGSPVTSSGTIAISYAAGYSIPTTISQSNWNDAYTFVSNFPTQTGNAGRFLTTNGSVLSWANVATGSVTSVAIATGSTGTDVNVSGSPITTSGTITINIPDSSATNRGVLTAADWSTFSAKMNNPFVALGDMVYSNSATAAIRLAGNITTAKQYLSQTGTGTTSAIPVWSSIAGADITGAALTATNDTNVTITLGGTPATALLRAASLTLGWSGTLAIGRGGTGLSALGTANQLIRVNAGATALEYFTPTFLTANQSITWTAAGDISGSASGTTAITPTLTTTGLRGVALPTLGATAGFLRYTGTGTNTWIFDTSTYLTANQTITLTGNVTGSGSTSIATTIGTNVVTNAMLAQVATATFKGRTTAATGNVEDLSVTQATAMLNTFTSALKGLAPASGGGTTNFLRADGTWAAPTGTGFTNPMTTLGDTLFQGAAAVERLAGNITTTKQFLSQTGTGTISAAPAWSAVTKSDVGLANVENTALSTWAGSANITTLGTITTGTWNGTTIAVARGGTGVTTANANTIFAGATSGGAAAPSFRSLVAADIPALTLENVPDAWVKRAVRVATTANITLSGTQTIDGIAVVAGDRVLVKDQTTTSQNGIYIVAAGAWTRSLDADASSELAGAMVAVDLGTTNGGTTWDTDFRSSDTLGTTGMVWHRVIDTGYNIPVSQGGTGATTLTGILVGNGTSAVTAVAGTASQLLRRNAGNTAYEFFTPTYLTANQTITLSGDVTGSGSTAISTTIANNVVTLAKMQQIATASFLGRTTAATGNVEVLTATQATALLNVFSSTLKGLAPASGGGTTNFLRADGTWAAPAGSGVSGSGTANTITKWTGATALGDSSITDNGNAVTIQGLQITNFTGLPVTTAGNLAICDVFSSPDAGRLFFGDGTGWKFHFSSRTSSVTTDIVSIVDNIGIGINTASPVNFGANYRALEIKGAATNNGGGIRLSTSDSSLLFDQYVGGGAAFLLTSTNIPMIMGANGAEVVRLTPGVMNLTTNASKILAGSASSTNGSIILQDNYSSGNLTNFGTSFSSGAPVIGFAVTPSTAAEDNFFSSTTLTSYPRGAMVVRDSLKFFTGGAQTASIGSAVSMLRLFEVKANGQMQLPFYTSSSSYTGTAAGYLAFDSSGNVITTTGTGGGGGFSYSITSVSTTYTETATSGAKVILASTTGGAFTITLPTAVGNTAMLVIKKTAGTPTLTIDANGTQTIDGGLTASVVKVYESITLVSDNANWHII